MKPPNYFNYNIFNDHIITMKGGNWRLKCIRVPLIRTYTMTEHPCGNKGFSVHNEEGKPASSTSVTMFQLALWDRVSTVHFFTGPSFLSITTLSTLFHDRPSE